MAALVECITSTDYIFVIVIQGKEDEILVKLVNDLS